MTTAHEKHLNLCNVPHEDYALNEIEFGDRVREEYANIPELAESIRESGLIHPLAVTRNPPDSVCPVRLVAGGRRYTALKYLQDNGYTLGKLTCRVFDELNEYELRTLELLENVQRNNLTFYEDAKAKKAIHELYVGIHGIKTSTSPNAPGHSMKDTATVLNVSPSQLYQDDALLRQMEAVKDSIDWSQLGKTRSEAKKVLQQIEKQAKRSIGADKAKKILGDGDDRIQRLSNAYIIEDCTVGMKKIGAGTQDFVEIDPPYAVELHRTKKSMDANYDGYNEVDKKDYIKLMRSVFDEAWRIMKQDSWLVCWFGMDPWSEVIHYLLKGGTVKSAEALLAQTTTDGVDHMLPPFKAEFTQARFKVSRRFGVWTKDKGQTQQPMTQLASGYEGFYYARKGDAQLHKPGMLNVLNFTPVHPDKKTHPTERPADMISHLLDIFALHGAAVTVPFAGSGRTMLEAAKKNMIPIGFDLHSGFKDAYLIKLVQEIK